LYIFKRYRELISDVHKTLLISVNIFKQRSAVDECVNIRQMRNS
jgi:hypothetical protein